MSTIQLQEKRVKKQNLKSQKPCPSNSHSIIIIIEVFWRRSPGKTFDHNKAKTSQVKTFSFFEFVYKNGSNKGEMIHCSVFMQNFIIKKKKSLYQTWCLDTIN